jgi:hypothetical protein
MIRIDDDDGRIGHLADPLGDRGGRRFVQGLEDQPEATTEARAGI